MSANIYWRALRGVFIGWLAALGVFAVFVVIIMHRQSGAEEALAQAEQKWLYSKQQSAKYASYQPDLDDFLAQRERWQAVGLLQIPNLDRWESAWVNMQQQFSLPHFAYQIEPSMACPSIHCTQQWPFKQWPSINFTLTPLRLSWSVDHELAVLPWIQQLQQAYRGMLLIRRCEWHLAETEEAVAVQCDLVMFNFPDVLTVAGQS